MDRNLDRQYLENFQDDREYKPGSLPFVVTKTDEGKSCDQTRAVHDTVLGLRALLAPNGINYGVPALACARICTSG
jgi:hypothetical protein